MGSYCIYDDDQAACTSDSDCTNSGTLGSCVGDSSVPATAALFCIPPTTSAVINAAGGIPGPGAAGIAAIAQICRCGNGTVACDEECDNGGSCVGGSAVGTACTSNSTCAGGGACEPQSGDGCDENCYNE
jgi:hypothetical protein